MIERYTRPEMGKIWTPENRYQAWLRVELAVCEAWNRVGEISDADMETLRKEADFTVDRAFVDRANEIEETTRHDVIAFLTAIEEKVGPVSRFIHLGCTSSDIVDTAGSLLMVEAGELILKAFDRVLAVLKKMTLEHQGLLCMGRTHGIHARARLNDIVEKSLRGAAIWDEVKDRLRKNALGLSGGQQQRLCIARALAVEPDVLLMDEPTSALDPISTSKIEELAMQLKEQYTIVIVTHNMQQAVRISDNTAFFLLGELVEYGKTEEMFSQPTDKRTEDYITGRFG